jgi:serine/threonine protein kinase
MPSRWCVNHIVQSLIIAELPEQLDDIIQGLMYLHSENIVHGDLCGVSVFCAVSWILIQLIQRNILINERRACLTDFGLAAFVELDTSIQTSTRKGSTRWMAPELLLPDVYHPGLPFRQTPASDVWAFGCVCCEVRSFTLFTFHNDFAL